MNLPNFPKTLAMAYVTILAAQCGAHLAPVSPPTIVASIETRGIDTSLAWFASDAEGGFWIVDAPDYSIHRIDMATRKRSDYSLPQDAEPHGAVTGGDGALWLADYSNSELLRYDAAGTMTAHPVGHGVFPYGLVNVAGKFWFVEHTTQAVGTMTLAGTVTTIPIPMPGGLGGPMARDDDGTLWVGGRVGSGAVGRLDVDGSFHIVDSDGQLAQLFACPDGGVAYISASGSGYQADPWIEHIGLLDARGRSVHANYAEPVPTPTPPEKSKFQVHSPNTMPGPLPPPGAVLFACTAEGAWFVIDKKVIGHVDHIGGARYFPVDALAQAPAGVTSATARTAWVAVSDRVIELSY